jgi:hypothetical protein
MKLEEGETYKTRGGEFVTITKYVTAGIDYPYRGLYKGRDEYWTENGTYQCGTATSLDLIERMKTFDSVEESTPKDLTLEELDAKVESNSYQIKILERQLKLRNQAKIIALLKAKLEKE